MAVSARRTGLSVSVFTLGGDSYICELENSTLTVEIEDEDARGVCDAWEYPWALSKRWSLEIDLFVAGAGATLVAEAATGDGVVTVAFTTGGNAYTGTCLVSTAGHTVGRSALQKQASTLKGQGALSLTPP